MPFQSRCCCQYTFFLDLLWFFFFFFFPNRDIQLKHKCETVQGDRNQRFVFSLAPRCTLFKHLLPWGCLALPGKPTVLQARVHLCPEMFMLLFVCSLAQKPGNLGFSQSICTCGIGHCSVSSAFGTCLFYGFIVEIRILGKNFQWTSLQSWNLGLFPSSAQLIPFHPFTFNLLHVIKLILFLEDECCFKGS